MTDEEFRSFVDSCVRVDGERVVVGYYDHFDTRDAHQDDVRGALNGLVAEAMCRHGGWVLETLRELRDARRMALDYAGASAIDAAIDVLFPVED